MSRDTSDPEQVKAAAEKEKFGRAHELNDLREILATPGGRRFIWRYLSECGVFRTSFTGNSQTFFNEGRREIGLRILADVTEADHDAYSKMSQEAKLREVKSNA